MEKVYWKLHTNPRILEEDNDYILEENTNYPSGEGNIFLMQFPQNGGPHRCIGGIDNEFGRGVWVASVSAYDECDPDVDCREVYRGDRETAIEKLWQNRFNAM